MDQSSVEEQNYGKCVECEQIYTGQNWCQTCNSKRFQQNFDNWTSGNDYIDKFTQNNQLSAKSNLQLLEWIPYDKFQNVEYIATILYALKSLNNSQKITLEFINKIICYDDKLLDHIIRCYGITQDPNTKDYIMILNFKRIAAGLKKIHEKELIHQNLHTGNILRFYQNVHISDIGLCRLANYNELENKEKCLYGVLPYIAPEVLIGQHYTKASDIYSFGIIIYKLFSKLPPYYDVPHDNHLALKICEGLRLSFKIEVPQLVLHIIKRCLDANPLNRPNAEEFAKIFYEWSEDLKIYIKDITNQKKATKTELIKQFEKINNSLSTTSSNLPLSDKIHPEVIYMSRLLDFINFNNLPVPKNSDDYYENFNNISSVEYSGT
ncbi:kinase-like domain-containing protein [Glomus cerebriforme]|uniref:Kinase-like domain-containing protein n=1 Tax=Glomus cerebriforme TaxID=658196 RepID=A0A397TA12_9GLOM|nr:kinase-like domain-containing protein [Glomus cerebriforme]